MFILEAEKVMGESWEIYSSGGGCYHAVKEFKSLQGDMVAVEVHYEGCAQMYHDDIEETNLVDKETLYNEDLWCNYISLGYIHSDTNEAHKEADMNAFDVAIQDEIIEAMVKFAKVYDSYMGVE